MDQPLPVWLTKDFLAESLRREEGKESLEVVDFTASPEAPTGSNYGTRVIRVGVEVQDGGESNSLHLLVKSETPQGAVQEIMDEIQMNEPVFYYKFLPEARRLTDVTFAPECFYSPVASATVLEDLKDQGFVIADRTKLLDFDHCRLYMAAAASLHAVSFAVHKKQPALVESMGREKFFVESQIVAETFMKLLDGALASLAKWTEGTDGFHEYGKIIREASGDLWHTLLRAHRPGAGFNCLTQGDPWTNNMMFRYEDGGVREVKLVDFQCLRYASPAADLVFFVWTSADHDVRSKRFEELCHFYVETLNDLLKSLDCSERLTFDNVMKEVGRLRAAPLWLAAVMFPFMVGAELMDFNAVLKKENTSRDIEEAYDRYYDEEYRRHHLPRLLGQMEAAGVLANLAAKC